MRPQHVLDHACLEAEPDPRAVNYCFTAFGDVYIGYPFEGHLSDKYMHIVQAGYLDKFTKLQPADWLELGKQYAWAVPQHAIKGYLSANRVIKPLRQNFSFPFQGQYNRTHLIIVGAGASSHCVSGSDVEPFTNDPRRPPMGNELLAKRFKDIYDRYPGAKECLFNFDSNVDLEEVLETEWANAQKHANRQVMSRQINLQFYLQDLIRQVSDRVVTSYDDFNLYARLADALQKLCAGDERLRFAFVSFNQDTLLEHFLCRQFRMGLHTLDDYAEINESPFSVFKPHGSWNWGWTFPNQQRCWSEYLHQQQCDYFDLYYNHLGSLGDMVDWSGWGLESGLNEDRKGKLSIDKSKLELFAPSHTGKYFPAMLLPYKDKDEFNMPWSHYLKLSNYLPSIETLTIIGWKGNEKLFNRLLKDKAKGLKKVIIVDPYPRQVEANLSNTFKELPPIEIIRYEGGFEEFAKRGLSKAWLEHK